MKLVTTLVRTALAVLAYATFLYAAPPWLLHNSAVMLFTLALGFAILISLYFILRELYQMCGRFKPVIDVALDVLIVAVAAAWHVRIPSDSIIASELIVIAMAAGLHGIILVLSQFTIRRR